MSHLQEMFDELSLRFSEFKDTEVLKDTEAQNAPRDRIKCIRLVQQYKEHAHRQRNQILRDRNAALKDLNESQVTLRQAQVEYNRVLSENTTVSKNHHNMSSF